MRIALVHPNDHSGGAEIAGNWPPAWARASRQAAQADDMGGAMAKACGGGDQQMDDVLLAERPTANQVAAE